jgi:DNA helicase II / ATP-dependent DNA helicase PcrA
LKISDEQQAIIDSKVNTIVISNPGAGKTTTLSLKVIDLLKNDVSPEKILCITYTAKAKKEMFDTIYKMAQEQGISDSITMKIHIHTFHGMALDYLTNEGLIAGDIVGNNLLRYSILESFEANKALNYDQNYIIEKLLGKVENSIRYIKSFGITHDKIDLEKTEKIIDQTWSPTRAFSKDDLKKFLQYFVDAYKHYEASKEDSVDYSDILLTFKSKFEGDKFQYVLVDEIQDMNEIEAEIIEMIFENLFLFGDSKQAIFGFQGGSTKNFQRFSQSCKPMLLSTNRRSTQEILDYAKKQFLDNTNQRSVHEKELENFTSPTNGPIPKIFSTKAPHAKILSLIKENPQKEIGIIMRNNYQIVNLSKFLDSNGINYTTTSSQAITAEAKNQLKNFIRGRISSNVNEIIAATFTSFSPFPLQEAFEFSSAIKRDGTLDESKNVEKLKSWKINLTRDDIDQLFLDEIYPKCVSKGEEWFFTAISVKQQIDEYLSFETPTFEGLFDFIAIAEESYVERSTKSAVTLTTVHKAKGRSFDIVIYLPTDSTGASGTKWIDNITTSILKSREIDVGDEILEESLRIDFVACTRAKEKLFLIADETISNGFQIEKLSKIELDIIDKDETAASIVNTRYSEAYALFVSGRYSESQDLLKTEDVWLEDYIRSYFKNIDHFSYSNITEDPYLFLMRNIVKKPYVSTAADYGNRVHKALQKIMKGKAKLQDYTEDEQKSIKNGLDAIDELKVDYPGLTLHIQTDGTAGVEAYEKISISKITTYPEKDNFFFSGYIDMIFEYNEGIIIVDWKTDKNSSNAAKHKRQLQVYKKMHSNFDNIPEDKIKACVVFVALRGSVNTGKFEKKIDFADRDTFGTFEGHLQTVLEWKKEPTKFIKKLVEQSDQDELHKIIKEKLGKNIKLK